MRPIVVRIACLILPLAGCMPGDVASAPGPLAIPARFRALGTEPFWSLSVVGRNVRYSTPEIPEEIARHVVRDRTGGIESVSGTLGAVHFRLTVEIGRCSDGMSDRVYPLAASLRIGDRNLQGCAASD